MLTVFSKLIGLCFSLYLEWLLCYIICPKLSLLWRLCFVELFCWYKLFMSVGAYTVAWGLRCLPHKMKCWHRKEETCSKQAVFAPAYNSMNARCVTVTVAQRLDRTRNTFRDKKIRFNWNLRGIHVNTVQSHAIKHTTPIHRHAFNKTRNVKSEKKKQKKYELHEKTCEHNNWQSTASTYDKCHA